MAPVVKRLRPRIVVPICMGSNPIRRPIYTNCLYGGFFVRYIYNTSVSLQLVEHFKPVVKNCMLQLSYIIYCRIQFT